MAVVRLPNEQREIHDPQEIRDFLAPHGIWFENWDVDGRLSEGADSDAILATYEPEINRLKEEGGFVTADVISVDSSIPNIDELCAKFAVEHTHSEDEVRFTVDGRGIFFINPEEGPVFGITVEKGDLINVPKGTRHWFNLCDDKTIKCIRLFEDPSGWTPHYVDDPQDSQYAPLCFGPKYLAGDGPEVDPVVKL